MLNAYIHRGSDKRVYIRGYGFYENHWNDGVWWSVFYALNHLIEQLLQID
jgi:hypothetical protein